MNTTALAFIGDAVYEVFVRETVLATGQSNADALHRMAVKYARAEGQAQALKALLPMLTAEELALVKRARNRKSATKPKNVDPVLYKLATAFEALVGQLYLSGNSARLVEILESAIKAIDGAEAATQDKRGRNREQSG